MNKKFILLLGFYLVFVFTNLFSQIDEIKLEEFKQEIRLMIEKEMKMYKVMGISIALVDDQDVIWSDGFGYADQTNKIPATSQTIYRVGSVSKLFTATSVMQLAEKNKINIDTSIQIYIPEFKIKSRFENQGAITPQNLMTHHSGLPSDIEKNFFCEKQIPFTEIINDLNQEYTCFQPNTVFSYSNCGYSLLGVLVEKVSGENFYDYTKNNLFEPMEMKNSSFVLTEEMQKLYSKGYNKGVEVNELYIRDVPAGMLHSNVEDLSNFIKMIFNNGKFKETQVIENNTLNIMMTKQNTNVPLDLGFEIGLGWWINSAEWNYAGKFAEHGGDTYVYHASVKLLTEQKIGVIVLTNSASGAFIKDKIAKIILEKYLKLKKDLEKTINQTPVIYKSAKNDNLKKYEGQYVFNGGFVLDLKAKKNKKLTFKQGPITLALKYNNKNSFDVNILLLGFIPINIKDQKIMFQTIDNYDCMIIKFLSKNDSTVLAVKTQKTVLTEKWKNRIGKYDVLNDNEQMPLFSDFELIEENDFLFLKCKIFTKQKYAMILKPLNDNEAIIDGIGRNTGNTVTFKDDEIYLSGLILKKKIK